MAGAKEVFEHIHTTNMWGNEESVSGPGSTFLATELLRDRLKFLLEVLGIKSILDIPCGDCNFMQNLDLNKTSYLGCDIVEDLIKENSRKFGDNSNMKFQQLDALNDPIPEAELILCRDMIVHFPNEASLKFLKKVKESSCKYILTTNFVGDFGGKKLNMDIDFGYWRPVCLTKPPFSFPEPLLMIPELAHNKTQSLWRIEDLHL